MKLPHRNGLQHLCETCGILHRDCVCQALSRIDPGIEIRFLLHASELPKQSNTGGIAHAMLAGSSMQYHGLPGQPTAWEQLVDPSRPGYLLYPTPEAELASPSTFAAVKDPYVVVLDGTWGQTRRMFQRNAALHGLVRLRLPRGPLPRWQARNAKSESQYCTLEALIHLLAALGRTELCPGLWGSLDLVNRRLMRQRGL